VGGHGSLSTKGGWARGTLGEAVRSGSLGRTSDKTAAQENRRRNAERRKKNRSSHATRPCE
jgi:hypothetical protein